jgi:hypothetical protein
LLLMHFTALSVVELQLIMHGCDQRSLVALGQCSRATFSAASSAFAWQLHPPIAVRCDCPALRLPSSLLHFARVSLDWRATKKLVEPPQPKPTWWTRLFSKKKHSGKEEDNTAAPFDLASVLRLPRLSAIDTRGALPADDATTLLRLLTELSHPLTAHPLY